jgi:MFS family permease
VTSSSSSSAGIDLRRTLDGIPGTGVWAPDPREIINGSIMSAFQWATVSIMVGLSALDGYDVLSISFAAPGIAQQWGIDRAALGVVLSMETLGMALGSVILGSVADRAGRRTTILCACSSSPRAWSLHRRNDPGDSMPVPVVTGIGVGGMMAATTAGTAEAASGSKKSLCVALVGAGYPLGAVLGGKIAVGLLASHTWPIIFEIGAVATLCFIPLVLWLVPESIDFIIRKAVPDALCKINRALRRMGHREIDALPVAVRSARRSSFLALFSPPFGAALFGMTLAYCAHVLALYFLLKWIPKIVADMGFTVSVAGDVLVAANIGGVCGSVALALLSTRVRVLPLTVTAMLLAAFMIAFFGEIGGSISRLTIVAALAIFFANAGVVGLYALFAGAFPVEMRAAATGLVIGAGRGASSLAPVAVGVLFAAGASLSLVSLIMAGGSLVAAVASRTASPRRQRCAKGR